MVCSRRTAKAYIVTEISSQGLFNENVTYTAADSGEANIQLSRQKNSRKCVWDHALLFQGF